MLTRRNIIPAALGLAIPSIALATGKNPPKCECKCKRKPGPQGPKGEKGDKGDKGDPGKCECKNPVPISIHADYELFYQNFPISQPDIHITTPNGNHVNDELLYFKGYGAFIFIDHEYHRYIIVKRGGEVGQFRPNAPYWDNVIPMGWRVWNWIARNPKSGADHFCIVSLDKILANTSNIIQDWTPINFSYQADEVL